MIASMIVCLWSELMARKLKAPTNIFMIPGIIPLLPGGTLYYTMEAMLQKKQENIYTKRTRNSNDNCRNCSWYCCSICYFSLFFYIIKKNIEKIQIQN